MPPPRTMAAVVFDASQDERARMGSQSRWLLLVMGLMLFSVPGTGMMAQAQDTATPPATTGSTDDVLFSVRPEDGSDGQPFTIELQPGQSSSLTVILGNEGTIPIELLSYTANVLTNPNGGLGIDEENVEHIPPTTWMDFPTQVDQLDPGQEVTRTIDITVPEDTPPGQYVNAIAVQTVDDYAIEGSTNFRQRLRKVSAVYVNVPGDLQTSFAVGQPGVEFSTHGPVIQIPVENTGTTWIRPYGELILSDLTGVELIKAPVVMGSIFVGHSTQLELGMNVLLPPGEYLISMELTDERSGESVSISGVAITMPEAPEEATPNPVTVQTVTVTPNADPPQFATVAVELANRGDIIPGGRLTISVSKDGEFVEDFVLADSVTLNPGITTIEQRYIPITGFESGTYTFSVKLESVDTSSGAAEVVLIQEDVATLEVP